MANSLVLMANSSYILGLAAALRSVLESLSDHSQAADIYLVDLGLEAIEKQQLGLMVSSFNDNPGTNTASTSAEAATTCGCTSSTSTSEAQGQQQLFKLSWLVPTPAQLAQLPVAAGTHAGAATWAKLLLPELLPCTVDSWVLYLDADVLVTLGTNLAEIWQEVEAAGAQVWPAALSITPAPAWQECQSSLHCPLNAVVPVRSGVRTVVVPVAFSCMISPTAHNPVHKAPLVLLMHAVFGCPQPLCRHSTPRPIRRHYWLLSATLGYPAAMRSSKALAGRGSLLRVTPLVTRVTPLVTASYPQLHQRPGTSMQASCC
jgi:hypothetical protein